MKTQTHMIYMHVCAHAYIHHIHTGTERPHEKTNTHDLYVCMCSYIHTSYTQVEKGERSLKDVIESLKESPEANEWAQKRQQDRIKAPKGTVHAFQSFKVRVCVCMYACMYVCGVRSCVHVARK